MAPDLAVAGDSVLMTWLESTATEEEGVTTGHALRFSRLSAATWSEPVTIASGEGFFANWADFPTIVQGEDGTILAHWLQKSGPSTYAYDILLARSIDGGETWEHLGPLHDDATQTEHGFVSFLPEENGIRAFWLDGRATAKTEASEEGFGHGGGGGAMTLRTARIADEIRDRVLLDERICDCCQTSAAMTPEGPIVLYRDRTEAEIRDISMVRRTGDGWSEPASVSDDGWEIPGCPVNGPSVAAGDRDVVATWFTVAGGKARVMAAFSEDAGAGFGPAVEIDGADPLGRVDVVMAGEREAIVSWLSTEGEQGAVTLRRVNDAGALGAPVRLASTSKERASGFPRIVRSGPALVVAWTEVGERTRVRASVLALESLAAPSLGKGPESGREAARKRPWDREPGSLAPEYEARAMDGSTVSLAEMRGRPFLVNFWATWCEPCREEMPELAALQERHRERGLRVIGVSLDAPGLESQVRSFVAEMEIPYLILNDSEGRAPALFGTSVLPATFLFDPEGVLVWRRFGVIRAGDPELSAALAEATGSSGASSR
jgi:thiol-disulfide isomerase/thioredoxin